MHSRALILPGPSGWSGPGWRPRCRHADSARASGASDAASTSTRGSYWDRVKGFRGPWNAALTSGSLTATGDLLAQLLQSQLAQRQGKASSSYDPSRTLRMLGFGICFYGPLQFYWYNLLNWLLPATTTATFLTKVAANQLVLAPMTVSSVLSWNLYWQGQSQAIPDKLRTDMIPTMMNGWKFWIPAASVNFYAVPLQYQVLYMSMCGVLWTGYLSYASSTRVAEPQTSSATTPTNTQTQAKKK